MNGAAGDAGLIDTDYLRGQSIRRLRDDLLNRSASGVRAVRELDNKINLHWYHGRAWCRRHPTANKIIWLHPDQRQRFVYVNKTFDVVRTLNGVMFYVPSMEARPRTIDPEDIARAHVATDVGNHTIKEGRLARAYAHTLTGCNIKGLGWIKVVYDPAAGARRPRLTKETCPTCRGTGAVPGLVGLAACPQCSTQGLIPTAGGGTIGAGYIEQYAGVSPEGDVRYLPLDSDDVWPDPEAETVDDITRVVIRMRMDPGEAWVRYGAGLGFSEEDFEAAVSDSGNEHIYASSEYDQDAMVIDRRYVQVWEYYQKPSQKHPDGIFGVCVGDLEVQGGRLPYLHDTEYFPVFPFPMYQLLGELYPKSTVDIVLPLILAYNDHLSSLHARARLSAKLRFKVPRGSRWEMDDGRGNVLYTPTQQGHKPEELQLGSAPQDNANIIDLLGQAIDTLSGSTEVVRGAFQTADSARAMAFLEERALGPLKPIIADHAERLERVVQYGIHLARLHYDDGRVLRLQGAGGAVETREFKVDNVGEATDVALTIVRDVGRSRATMMAELNEAAAIPGVIDADTYMRVSGFGDVGVLQKERKLHMDQALQEEHILLEHGWMPPPVKFQRHDIHGHCHQERLIRLQSQDPNHPLIPALLQHLEATEQMQAMRNAQQAQIAQGIVAEAQPAAQAYGAMNAADGGAQPAQTQAGAAEAGIQPPQQEPFNNAPPGPPGSQASLAAAAETAGAY